MRYLMERLQSKRSIGRTSAAFTLVELLVVIAIIALLLSILMPALQKARDSAKAVACMAGLKQQGMASQLYCQNNADALIPSFAYADMSNTLQTPLIWGTFLAPYIGSQKGAKTIAQGGYWIDPPETVLKLFKCPAQKDAFMWNWYIRYGINMFHATDWFKPDVLKFTKISRPSIRLQIADAMDNVPSYVKLDRLAVALRGQKGYGGYPSEYIWPYEHTGMPVIMPVADRHRGGAEALFLDGHSQWFKYEKLMVLDNASQADRAEIGQMWDFRGSVK
jgi:prepilin-type N-terminal cleavage/methylation domain-containing protein/prepilin-type processing-associated H-X9-DG protein